MSGWDGNLNDLILHTIEQWWASRYSEKHGLVTSYDPKKYLAKVTFQPDGQESGWLPIETGHVGDGFGMAIGLTTGDGKTTGDQVVVRYQEGDIESGKIVQRVHSDKERPPEVQSGEMVIWTKFQKNQNTQDDVGEGDPTQDTGSGGQQNPSGGQGGTGQQLFFRKDNAVFLTDGNGASIEFDGQGNITISGNKITITSKGDVLLNTGNGNAVKINSGTIQVETIKNSLGSKDLLVNANGQADTGTS